MRAITLTPVLQRSRANEHKHRRHRHCEAHALAESLGSTRRLTASAPEMRPVLVVDTQHVVSNPDARVGVELCIEGKDPARTYDEVVDVGRALAYRKGVPHYPLRPEGRQMVTHLDFTHRPDVPRPSVWVQRDVIAIAKRGV